MLIEAGLFAQHCLDAGNHPHGATQPELQLIALEGQGAWEMFFDANTAMVRAIVARWRPRDDSEAEELIHEGQVGLVEAIMRFDHLRGWRFSTLAWNLISSHVSTAAVGPRSCGSATVSHARRVAEIERARAGEVARLGREVSVTEIALSVGRRPEAVSRDLQQAHRVDADPHALEELVSGHSARSGIGPLAGVHDELPWDGDELDFLADLPTDERVLLRWHFGVGCPEPLPLREIAQRMDISVSAASRLKARAIAHGRQAASRRLAA